MAKRSTNLNRANRSARLTPGSAVSLMEWVGMSQEETRSALEDLKTRMEDTMRVGDIVKTPEGTSAIVIARAGDTVEVERDGAQKTLGRNEVTPYAHIALGDRTYRTGGGNWFRVVYVHLEGREKPVEHHVRVGSKGDLSHETRALEIRKLAYAELRAKG